MRSLILLVALAGAAGCRSRIVDGDGGALVSTDLAGADQAGAAAGDLGAACTPFSEPTSPDVVDCGNELCALPTRMCCVTDGTPSSGKCQGGCLDGTLTFSCDGPDDCHSVTKICCHTESGAQCASSCNGGQIMCHADADCPKGETCTLGSDPPHLPANSGVCRKGC